MSIQVCTVCSSNMNRSMEAHRVLEQAGYKVVSFGTGNAVKIPGLTKEQPNVFAFGTPYTEMLKALEEQESTISPEKRNYAKQGLYEMLNRNIKLKEAPENWQSQETSKLLHNEVIISCDEKCYELILEDCFKRGRRYEKPLLVLNLDVEDFHANSVDAGKSILRLMEMFEDLKKNNQGLLYYDYLDQLLGKWQMMYPHLPLLYSLIWL
ncbi:hypothetical protein QEN19_002277 [Hanseniaspora menglaensis]